ncbi:MAG: formylglycine-generating enzyme family protein, partial [Bradymonadia bacterium]
KTVETPAVEKRTSTKTVKVKEKTKAPVKKSVSKVTPKKSKPVRADKKKDESVARSTSTANDGVELSCPSGMRLLRTMKFPKGTVRRGKIKGTAAAAIAKAGGAYCIDAYEFPGRGKRPKTNVTRTTAAALCKRADKRLCSSREWRSACTGRGGAVFPYGRAFNAGKCATEDNDGEERSVGATGRFKKCRSASGAYDMVGNVGEWTVDGRVRGGDVTSSDEDASCAASEARSPSYAGGKVGFRCCTDFREE